MRPFARILFIMFGVDPAIRWALASQLVLMVRQELSKAVQRLVATFDGSVRLDDMFVNGCGWEDHAQC
jgi:hypothetical protein